MGFSSYVGNDVQNVSNRLWPPCVRGLFSELLGIPHIGRSRASPTLGLEQLV